MPRALEVLNGKEAGSVLALEGEPSFEIGTARRSALRLRDRGVSYTHARLRLTGEQLLLEDLSSSAGTFVNGERVASHAKVGVGDELRFGQICVRVLASPAEAGNAGAAEALARGTAAAAMAKAAMAKVASKHPQPSSSDAERRVTRLESQLARIQAELAEAKSAEAEAKAEAQAAKSRARTQRAATEEELAAVREALEVASGEVLALRESLSESCEEGPATGDPLDPSRVAALEAELLSAREEATDLRQQLEEINEELIELEDEKSRLEAELERQPKELER